MEKQIPPLANVSPRWDNGMGGYPTRVRLAMADGSLQMYWLEVKQPKPHTEYIGKHAKRTGSAATPSDPQSKNIQKDHITYWEV